MRSVDALHGQARDCEGMDRRSARASHRGRLRGSCGIAPCCVWALAPAEPEQASEERRRGSFERHRWFYGWSAEARQTTLERFVAPRRQKASGDLKDHEHELIFSALRAERTRLRAEFEKLSGPGR